MSQYAQECTEFDPLQKVNLEDPLTMYYNTSYFFIKIYISRPRFDHGFTSLL